MIDVSIAGRKEGEDMNLITHVTDRKGHDMCYAIDSRKLQKELGREPSTSSLLLIR